MNPVPDFIPVLSHGKHESLADGACAMEMVAFLAGEPHSDTPECTHPVLAELARSVNDYLDDDGRQRLAPLLPALIGTAATDRIIGVSLAVWCALEVADLIEDEDMLGLALAAIYAGEKWCDNPTDARAKAAQYAHQDCTAARLHLEHQDAEPAAAALSAAQSVTSAVTSYAAFAAAAAAAASFAAAALERAGRAADLPDFLDRAIAEYQRLTGHEPHVADALDWAGLSEAMEGAR